MSARDKAHDTRIIAELRAYRSRLAPGKDRYLLIDDEVDALLDAAAERDELKAAACAMPGFSVDE